MVGPSPSPARCVHCGGAVPLLYRSYSSTVLKMMTCGACGQVADKYIEYDPVLVLLDLVLLNRQAIRHILYNTNFESYWKLGVIMALIEGYVTYCSAVEGDQCAGPGGADGREPALPPPSWDPSQLDGERLFYAICGESALATLAFLAVAALGCRALGARVPLLLLAKALVLGSFAVFLWLPARIWTRASAAEPTQSSEPAEQAARCWVDAALVGGYTFLGLTQTLSVLCVAPRPAAALVAGLALGAKAAARGALRGLDPLGLLGLDLWMAD